MEEYDVVLDSPIELPVEFVISMRKLLIPLFDLSTWQDNINEMPNTGLLETYFYYIKNGTL